MKGQSHSERQATTATTLTHELLQHPNLCPKAHDDLEQAHMMHYMMTQLSMNKGLNRWGKKGEQAVSKELS